MEYTQWEHGRVGKEQELWSLNPCCNGIYSMRGRRLTIKGVWVSLNPCCNGIYSMSMNVNVEIKKCEGLS